MEKMKEMRKMENNERQVHDQPVQDGTAKKRYKTPELTKMGNVKQLTQHWGDWNYDGPGFS